MHDDFVAHRRQRLRHRLRADRTGHCRIPAIALLIGAILILHISATLLPLLSLPLPLLGRPMVCHRRRASKNDPGWVVMYDIRRAMAHDAAASTRATSLGLIAAFPDFSPARHRQAQVPSRLGRSAERHRQASWLTTSSLARLVPASCGPYRSHWSFHSVRMSPCRLRYIPRIIAHIISACAASGTSAGVMCP